jgi:hypothetical protein
MKLVVNGTNSEGAVRDASALRRLSCEHPCPGNQSLDPVRAVKQSIFSIKYWLGFERMGNNAIAERKQFLTSLAMATGGLVITVYVVATTAPASVQPAMLKGTPALELTTAIPTQSSTTGKSSPPLGLPGNEAESENSYPALDQYK